MDSSLNVKKIMRVDKRLSSLGYCTRQQAKKWLKEHKVLFQGLRIVDPSAHTDSSLSIDDEPLDFPDGILIALHKPLGYVCTHNLIEGKLIYDLLPEQWRCRHPAPTTVGRLDKETSGLILITDQMQWVHEWIHPKKKVQKCYQVRFEGSWQDSYTELFASGTLALQSEPEPCLPAKVTLINERTAHLFICEGRYHQVRRMFAAVGCPVKALHRIQFGKLKIEGLEEGKWKQVLYKDII